MDSKFQIQEKLRVYQCFGIEPKSMKQVAVELGIDRANICYYVGDFKKHNRIAIYKKGICPITNYRVQILTTDTALFPEDNQTRLFE